MKQARVSYKMVSRVIKGKTYSDFTTVLSFEDKTTEFQVSDIVIYRETDIMGPELRLHFSWNKTFWLSIPEPVSARSPIFNSQKAFYIRHKKERFDFLSPAVLYLPYYYFDFKKHTVSNYYGYLTEHEDCYTSKKFPEVVIFDTNSSHYTEDPEKKAEATELFIQKSEIELDYMLKKVEIKDQMKEELKKFKVRFGALKAEKNEKLNEILREINYIDPLNRIEEDHNEIEAKMMGGI